MLSRVAVIVLAAGLSTRFGAQDKLMANVQGRPMIAHVLDMVRGLTVGQRVMVTRAESAVLNLSEGFEVVINPAPEAGMGRSLAMGVAAVRPDIEAVMVVLGDMPFVTSGACAAVLAAADGDIVVPLYGGRQGHPVLFRRCCFAALRGLEGTEGGKSIMGAFQVQSVAVEGDGGLVDVDRPEDIASLK